VASDRSRFAASLTREELADLLAFCNDCLLHETETTLHAAMTALGGRFGFEFVLYAYMASLYAEGQPVLLRNLTNPTQWMEEYAQRGYLAHDPVRRELENRLARGERHGVFAWDAYERPLCPVEEEIITRRRAYGLQQGFSAYCESPNHDSVFLLSFASARKGVPSDRALLVGRTVVPHLSRCRKRLDLSTRVARLTDRERVVAGWLVAGKSNAVIAEILGLAEATAKFHVANILLKLETVNRPAAVAVLVAARSLA
jgi:DNA-binding CsgD family transcriptional regulator